VKREGLLFEDFDKDAQLAERQEQFNGNVRGRCVVLNRVIIVGVPVAPRVALNAHWTWLHTEVTDTGTASSVTFAEGATLIRRPAASGGATVSYRWQGATLAATATHVGERDDVDFSGFPASRVILPGYTTMDLGLDFPLHRGAGRSPGVDLTVRGENVFDAGYQQTVGYPGRARTWYVGGSLRY